VLEFHTAVRQPDLALVIFFCSSGFDLPVIAAEMKRLFGDTPVVGCTTAGEIGPLGYQTGTISGLSFAKSHFSVALGYLDQLEKFEIARGQALARQLLQELRSKRHDVSASNSFALQMIDGLSVKEEAVSHAFHSALDSIAIVGGSAGDDLKFSRTMIYRDGEFLSDCALLILVSTPLPFKAILSQHFSASDKRIVITKANPKRRIVYEIDGMPAAQVYARMVGADPSNIDPMRFAATPLTVSVGGNNYVRSISKVHPDGALEFFCAIDEGMVLRLAVEEDLPGTLEQHFADIVKEMGPPLVIIGYDCILRRLEIERCGITDQIANIMKHYRVVGFNTYGEQYCGIHMNQTFTGLAIGRNADSSDHD
jgi:hypothetical protein